MQDSNNFPCLNALVDCVDRGSIGHRANVSEEGAAPVRMTGNGQKRTAAVHFQPAANGCERSVTERQT